MTHDQQQETIDEIVHLIVKYANQDDANRLIRQLERLLACRK
jgi:hypothetical protein